MIDERERFEEAFMLFERPEPAWERLVGRRDRKQRGRRVAAGVLGIAVFALAAVGFARLLGSETQPAVDPDSPLLGTWELFAHGSQHTLEIKASGDGTYELALFDEGATVCDGLPARETGVGTLAGITEMTVTSRMITCDDGKVLADVPSITYTYDPETDSLSDSSGYVWHRLGSDPSPAPPIADLEPLWPQSTLEEVQEAQRLTDAGDPRYSWQVFPEGPPNPRMDEFFTRFLQEELGWEEFDWSDFPGLYAGVPNDRPWVFVAVRCALGQTNPLYPNDPEGRTCAPTIDEHRYETVYVGAEPALGRPDAIWVVTRWKMLRPSDVAPNYRDDSGPVVRRQVRQVVPPSDAEVTALVEAFLQARVDGDGAEEYLSPATSQIPLLYATTSGDPYERSEFELVQGPVWPGGWRQFTVRLFAAGGSTVVEQPFLVERGDNGRPVLVYGTLDPFEGLYGMGDVLTRENGGGLVEPYEFLDGEVTFDAAWPWDWYIGGWAFTPTMTTLMFDAPDQSAGIDQRLAMVADPLPVEIGCGQGPAPADAQALAQSIRSDPDLEATEPVAVSVGGIEGLQLDVVAAAGASVCEDGPAPQVVTPNDHDGRGVFLGLGQRMRLYLLDLPEGLSHRILAIAVTAPEVSFDHVMEAAEPIVDSLEFHPP